MGLGKFAVLFTDGKIFVFVVPKRDELKVAYVSYCNFTLLSLRTCGVTRQFNDCEIIGPSGVSV